MAQKKIEIASFPASNTIGVREDSGAFSYTGNNTFDASLGVTSEGYVDLVAYEWNTGIFSELLTVASTVVTKVELKFYFRNADTNPIRDIEFVLLSDAQISEQSQQEIWDDINDSLTIFNTEEIRGDEKTSKTLDMGDVFDSLTEGRIDGAPTMIGIGIRKKNATQGTANLGGVLMADGIDTPWRERDISKAEIYGPPQLIIYAETDESAHIRHQMKYTTSDPTTSQLTPSNSLGGYAASNLVYTEAQVGDSISAVQTTIPISTDSTFPTSTGLVQIGPEIMKYDALDSTSRNLLNVTRGVSPPFGYPSYINPYAEYVHYLGIDKLFNKSGPLIQYRCVALSQISSSQSSEVKAYLIQNPNSDVQIDIGIEVPKFDVNSGTLSASVSTDDTTFSSIDFDGIPSSTGFFNGGYVVIDSDLETIIDSYDETGPTAEFIVQDGMPANYATGASFTVYPAPSQTIADEAIAPTENSGRFFGFFGQDGSNEVDFGSIRQRGGRMNNEDHIYIWIKRTMLTNKKSTSDTGAIIMLLFRD